MDLHGWGIDRAVNRYFAGQQVHQIGAAGIEAVAADGDAALRDVQAGQCAVGHHRQASGQGGASGVDKAASGAGNAVVVGHQHVGFGACDFNKAVEDGGVVGHHLVQNHQRRVRQVLVGQNLASQLGLNCEVVQAVGIVQDQATFGDVELAVLVVRQAGR